MGEDESIALVNVKPANTGCGVPVSELYRQMSHHSPKVVIILVYPRIYHVHILNFLFSLKYPNEVQFVEYENF